MIWWFLFTIAGLLLTAHLASMALCLIRKPVRLPPADAPLPHITLMRPVCGLDPNDGQTLGSSFLQDYPSYDIVFCAQHEDDPVLPLLHSLIAQYPHVPARILVGDERPTGNPKLNNLWKGWNNCQSEWLCMADSNLLLPPSYLRELITVWNPGCGLVSAPAYGCQPENQAARIEAAFLNGNQARLQLAAHSLGFGFAQGKTLFWHRPFLESQGGLLALGAWRAEDVASTHMAHSAGLRVELPPRLYGQPLGLRKLNEVCRRQLRWTLLRREGFPLLYWSEPLNGSLLALVTATAAGIGLGLPYLGLIYAAFWYGAEWAFSARMGWPAQWRDALALIARDVIMPYIWLSSIRSPKEGITWRGNDVVQMPRGTGAQA